MHVFLVKVLYYNSAAGHMTLDTGPSYNTGLSGVEGAKV